LDAEVVPYHWDDREKLHQDFLSLQALYEELLRELAERLNTRHSVNHSLRYWRILVGPWLSYFVQVLFDRWEMIERAVSCYPIMGVSVMETLPERVIPNDMQDFVSFYLGDAWNEAIYGQLLVDFTNVHIEKVRPANHQVPLATPQQALTPSRRLKRKLAWSLSVFSQKLVRKNDAFFISSYLPVLPDLRLQWRLGQFPQLWRTDSPPKSDVDWSKRQWSMTSVEHEGFESIVRAMIPRHIPRLYLEGFDLLQARCLDLPWPKEPRLIFTSNSYSSDDIFKAWAAEKVEAGAPLVIGQHGGGYGTTRWDSMESHQLEISDLWLSWGWSDKNNPKIKPIGNLKLFGRKLSGASKGRALMVEVSIPRYSYRMFSVPVASQWLGYFEDQCRFVAALPKRLQEQLLLRLYEPDRDWGARQRWQDHFPQIEIDDGLVPIEGLIGKSRLYISTYNATTFLESLARNIPTIMFWNPKHWELRDSAIPFFEELKAVGIFHETPESAAQQMAKVWDDVDAWWRSESLQVVRQQFCYHYSRLTEDPLANLAQILHQVARQPSAIDH